MHCTRQLYVVPVDKSAQFAFPHQYIGQRTTLHHYIGHHTQPVHPYRGYNNQYISTEASTPQYSSTEASTQTSAAIWGPAKQSVHQCSGQYNNSTAGQRPIQTPAQQCRGQYTNTTSVQRPIQHHSTAVQRPVHNQYISTSANTNTSTAVQRPVHNSVHQYLGQYNTWFARVYGCRTPFASPTYHTADRHKGMALCDNPNAVHAVTQYWQQHKAWPLGLQGLFTCEF